MKARLIGTALILTFAATSSGQSQVAALASDHDGHVIIAIPGELSYGPTPAILPSGAKLAVLKGDPTKPGPFVMRLWMPANYEIPAHFHPADEHVTVVQGAFYVGLGATFDDQNATRLPVGTFASLSKGKQHFAFTREETVIQLHGIGPWSLTYVNSADDPSRQ